MHACITEMNSTHLRELDDCKGWYLTTTCYKHSLYISPEIAHAIWHVIYIFNVTTDRPCLDSISPYAHISTPSEIFNTQKS